MAPDADPDLALARLVAERVIARLGPGAPPLRVRRVDRVALDEVLVELSATVPGAPRMGAYLGTAFPRDDDVAVTASQLRYHHGFDTDAWEMEFSDEPADDVRITVRTDDPTDGAISAHVQLVGPREEAIAAVATHLQGFALECAHDAPRPLCPGHAHPLDPRVHGGIACWVCPKDPDHHVEPIVPGRTGA